jgi:hypothetical protein
VDQPQHLERVFLELRFDVSPVAGNKIVTAGPP